MYLINMIVFSTLYYTTDKISDHVLLCFGEIRPFDTKLIKHYLITSHRPKIIFYIYRHKETNISNLTPFNLSSTYLLF